MTQGKDVLTLQEAADMMGMDIKLMSRYLRNGVFPGIKIGRAWRIVRTDLIQAVTDYAKKGKHVPGAMAKGGKDND